MIFRPIDYGAIDNDPTFDSGPALNAMFTATMASADPAHIDLTGTWYTRQTIWMQCPPESRIDAGTIKAQDDQSLLLDPLVKIEIGSRSHVRGLLYLSGKESGHHQNRNVRDLVHLHTANACKFGGMVLRWAKRYAIRNAAEPNSNIISCNLGDLSVWMCGTPGGPPPLPDGTWRGPVAYTRAYTTASQIEREGKPNSPSQRARIYLDPAQLHDLQIGDYLQVDGRPEKEGGALVQVMEIDSDSIGDYLRVFPWPARWDDPNWTLLEGVGSWHVEAIIGGVRIEGGNTTGSHIEGLIAGYTGHGLQIVALYGCHVRGLVGEVVGSVLTVGEPYATTWGVSVCGLHPEIDGVAVLVGGLNVKRVCVISPVIDLDPGTPGGNGYHLLPRLDDGSPGVLVTWPLVQLP